MKTKSLLPLIGTRFNNLIITDDMGIINGRRTVECLCDCGNKCLRPFHGVKSGNNKSCGCAKLDAIVKRNKENSKHNMSKSHTYRSWCSMKDRCNNVNHKSYAVYGGAGIKVDEKWNVFQNFLNDVGKAPSLIHQIDRIDGTKGYYKENCRWATPKEQGRNKITNRKVDINGEIKCMSEWAEIAGIDRALFRYRLEHGWVGTKLLIKPTK